MATSLPPIATRNALPKRATGASRLVRPLLIVLALMVVAAASAASTWLWTSRNQPASSADGAATNAAGSGLSTSGVVSGPIFQALDAFTVTLQSSEIERLVHVRLTLRLDDAATRERIDRYMPVVRSRILMVLSNQSPEAIVTPQGKKDLAEAIRTALAEPFKPLSENQAVRDVLFTEFVVQ
jgi:flagellar FliL protein